MNPKVSILIPIYNVSPFIEKCATSLFNQNFDDIEYIFINDATPDDSVEKLERIIEQYSERKHQVKIIHNSTNKGLAFSRNRAINESIGDYILVVDSDDYIEPEMIEILYLKAQSENADIVVCDFFMEYTNKTEIYPDIIFESKEDNLISIIKHEQTSSSLCNKLVRRYLYTEPESRVPDGLNYCEDWYVMTRMFYFANKIIKVNQAFYHYCHNNENSITKTILKMHFQNMAMFWEHLDIFLKQHNEYEKYRKIMELPKTQSKVRLMIDTHLSPLRKEYSNLFHDVEMNCISQLKRGEVIMLLLVRYKLFGLAQLFHNLLVFKKQRNTSKTAIE